MKNVRWLFVGTLLIFGGCQDGSSVDPPADPPQEPQGDPGPVFTGPERPVNLVNHAVLAFRPDGGRLVGGYRTHRAVIGDGIVEVTPFTFEAGERREHPPMSLETTVITSDGELLASGLTSTDLADGTAILQRSDVEERVRNDVDGLHQEWSFNEAPADGDLVVEVTVTGYQYQQSTDGGLHFVSSDGAGLRYSHAVWTSSDGAEWPIAAVYVDGRIRLTVPGMVIAKTVFPALLDPTVTAEVVADVPVVGPTGTNQHHPAIAFNGTNYLVVWDDNRDSTDADIWGTRLSAAGAILDPLGIKIALGTGIQSNPTVAYNGTTFLVAWEDFKVSDGTDSDIGVARVSNAGAVTSLGRVATTGTSETRPALAARADGNALVVWNAAGALTGSIYNGTAFGGGFAVAAGAALERPGIAANPAGNYLVTWSAATDLHGQFVTTGGALSGAAFDVSAALGSQFASAATFDGTNYDVVWENNNSGINLYGARVSTAGTVLNTRVEGAVTVGGVAISTATANQESPSIRCLASGCLVVWQDGRNFATNGFDVIGQRLNPDFSLAGTDFVIANATGNQLLPVVGATTTGFFTAWADLRDKNALAVFGATVSTAGATGTAALLGTGNNRESTPSIGRAGNNFALFWTDSRVFGDDIRFMRFNGAGSKLDTTALSATSASLAQGAAAASTDLGTNLFVVWSDTRNAANNDIFGARVNLVTGTVVDAGGVAVTTGAGDQLVPAVASSGSAALVVWQDRRNGNFDIFGALVNSSGVVTVPDIAISTAAGDQTHPSVTWDPASSQFLVVWADQRVSTRVDIFGARVSSAGAVLDGAGVLVSTAANSRFAPAIATSTAGTVAVWQDRRNAPAGGYNIYGTRLQGGASLVVTSPAGIKMSNNTSRQSAPAIGGLGTGFVVVWSDDRAGQSDIFGQQLTSAGALSGVEFAVSATTDDESSPTVLGTTGTGTTLRVAYEVHRLDTSRIATRLIATQSDVGSLCSSASQCGSGFCVDGACCNSACGGNHLAPTPTAAGDCHGCINKFTNQPNGICSPIPTTSICRAYRHIVCDGREYCDGVSTTCGPDIGRNAGLVCDKALNVPAGTGAGVCPSAAAPGPHLCI